MNALTAKEVEYIVDSMSNEDLLMKQCTATAMQTMDPNLKSVCEQMVTSHQNHYNTLLQCLEQHVSVAPMQTQQ
ncbi:hypothetical protein ACFSTH_07205 [Paenibacillus yanchengensis]|uniref:Spore coat protein n=1 Tax=Paenibacillus yanchengensis TaxID=2035833 RepID=A0ABW4YLM5_9BACL